MKIKNNKENAGITLIALVVTIVVLLILTGITLVYVFGDNGLFELAKNAKDKTEQAKKEEQDYFNDIEKDINDYVSGNMKSVLIEDIIDKKQDQNTPAKDSLENPITIPKGFHVVPHGQDGVEYTYTGDKKPTVQDGIVIADDENNQFVWIPVGDIKNKSEDSNGPITNIQLARHTFDITIDSESYTVSGETGAVETTKTDGTGLKDAWVVINGGEYEYLEEVSTSTTYENTKAKNIEEFKRRVDANKGYYLARYEASYKDATHCYSKVSTGTPRTNMSTALTSGMLWNWITQPDAATVARNSFSNSNIESDLVNSYAWDTAIVFIQTYSGDEDYSKEVGNTTSGLQNTGHSTDQDKRCNIYDMASNTMEWTTETSTLEYNPCTARGGYYSYNDYSTGLRLYNDTSSQEDSFSFRLLLYVK